jgi:hypothetical protein
MIQVTFIDTVPASIIAIFLFVLIIIFYRSGHQLRIFILKKNPTIGNEELGAVSGALLGLLALLLAFTFGMSNSRFDTRRQLAVEEANAIGTVILRTEIYPDSIRTILKSRLRDYVEERIAFCQSGMDIPKMIEAHQQSEAISKEIWTLAADYARTDDITTRTSELIPALNAMIDIVTTRRAAGEANIPVSILYFLLILCLCASFLLGYERKNKLDWIVVTGFSLMLSITVFTIIDMDRPRSGLVTLDEANTRIIALREMFR